MKKLVTIIILFQLLISAAVVQTYLLSHNTLSNNNQWIATKKQVQMHLLGSDNFYDTKVALRRCRLNLGAWHGFHGVIYKEQIRPKQIEFDFLLTENSYLYFIFNKDADKYNAVRISANGAFSNAIVTVRDDGEFIKRTDLPIRGLNSNDWNHMKIIFDDDNFSFFLNFLSIGDFSQDLLERQYIGFSGSYEPVYVDNVKARYKGSDEILEESFCYNRNWMKAAVLSFVILLVFNLMTGMLMRLRKADFKKTAFTVIVINLMLLFISAAFFSVYYYTNEIKIRYPKLHGLYRTLLTQEDTFTASDSNYVNNKILNTYQPVTSEGTNRILFVGTSQTRGAGARTEEESFVRVLEDNLNRKGAGRFECINAGVHGVNSTLLLKYYENNWIKLKPDITLINLSNNDTDPAAFRSNLQRFVDLNRGKGIRTVFVLEANSREVSSRLSDFHKEMRETGGNNGIPVIDLHKYLLEKYDTGLLWWDGVHMTSYGQKLTAEFIAGQIMDIINDK